MPRSPEDAVDELLESVRWSDPLGLLAILHPDERTLLKSLYDSAGSAAESTSGVDVDQLLQAVHIEIPDAPLHVAQLADDIAWVSTDIEFSVNRTLDVEAADRRGRADPNLATTRRLTCGSPTTLALRSCVSTTHGSCRACTRARSWHAGVWAAPPLRYGRARVGIGDITSRRRRCAAPAVETKDPLVRCRRR